MGILFAFSPSAQCGLKGFETALADIGGLVFVWWAVTRVRRVHRMGCLQSGMHESSSTGLSGHIPLYQGPVRTRFGGSPSPTPFAHRFFYLIGYHHRFPHLQYPSAFHPGSPSPCPSPSPSPVPHPPPFHPHTHSPMTYSHPPSPIHTSCLRPASTSTRPPGPNVSFVASGPSG